MICGSCFSHHSGRSRIESRLSAAGLLLNPSLNTVPGIPNLLLSISCLRHTSTITFGLMKSASSRLRNLCARWWRILSKRSLTADGFKAALPEFAVTNAAKDFTAPIPIAAGFPQRLQMEKTTLCRQRFPSGTILMSPAKHAVHGLG
jgi:hypothetical protein